MPSTRNPSVSLNYYSYLFPPIEIKVNRGRTRLAIHILKPSERVRSATCFVLVSDQGLEKLPSDINRGSDEMILFYSVESGGTYRVLEKDPIASMKVSELQSLAQKFGIEGRSKMVKQDLVSAVKNVTRDSSYSELKKALESVVA